MAPTIAIIAAGAMGAAVARRFTEAGATVLTNLDGRSEPTRRRAHDAGMQDVPFAELARRSSFLLSILPPSEAARLATRYLEAYNSTEASHSDADRPIYVDCNAVSPETAHSIAALFAGSSVRFVDAGIIGGPPREGYDPTFYASADATNTPALDAFEALGAYGMKIATLREDGAGVGDASALKMSYAGITKGLTGLFTTMILAAHAASPATSAALMRELHASQPLLLQRLTLSIPPMLPKAYRWVGEMHEISDFVGGPSGDVYKGMASVYERVERAVAQDGPDKQVLDKFVEDAKKLLEERNKKD
ncbi:6-phosphogluconate dehydrogenase C-terminal domain-like protein [Dentipellis sp. KUC8613]|nr:6-phosphogluconate dehydrogenase C-terminal domain-like protein [Dentipellis sp. KUC8613]